MSRYQSGSKLPNQDDWFKEQFYATMDYLYQNGKPSLSLQFVLNRYIDAHGEEGRNKILNEFGWDTDRLRRYCNGSVPSVKTYKTLIKICIIIELGYDDAWQLMINCGFPPNDLDSDLKEKKDKRAHYAILKHIDMFRGSIEKCNNFLRENGFSTLD